MSVDTVRVALDEGAYMPQRAYPTDAGADVMTPVGFTIPPRGSFIVKTGIHIETPHGYATMVKSKSGLNIRRGITSEGVVDEGYDGEIVVKLYNHTDEERAFERGDKVTQLVIVPVLQCGFEQCEGIGAGDRGSSGFGSTGR